jgi:AAA domain
MPIFTPHQDAALTAASNWLKAARGRASIFRLFGYAGTGKTTLAKHLAEGVDGKVLFAAFTGKAACVMRSKGCQGAATIHSLIYKARESGEEMPSFELWDEAPASKAKLIVIDECSMVDAELARDLMSFGVPLLVLGDPAQLPPIQGGGFFTDAEPDAMLTERCIGKPKTTRSCGCRWRSGPAIRWRKGATGDRGGAARRIGSRACHRRRSGSRRPQRHAARLQRTPARASRFLPIHCRWRATSSSACATTGAKDCSMAASGW